MKAFTIIAHGDFLPLPILQEAIQNKKVIALDGAANELKRLKIRPDVILGDFDCINSEAQEYWGVRRVFDQLGEDDPPYEGNDHVLIVPAKNQMHTDLTKAIQYCDQQQANEITIICAMGGRMDQELGALRSLRVFYRPNRPIVIHTTMQSLRFAKDATVYIRGEVGDKCGVLAFPKGSFSSQGLVYEANNFELDFGFSESICNAMKLPEAELKIQGEALIVMPPLLKSQRS